LSGSSRKGAQKFEFFKKEEVKKYHQLILGNHQFSGERREEEIRK